MNLLRKADKALDKLIDIMLVLGGVIVIVDMVLVAQDVIIRKAFNYTWVGLYEILTYSLVWMTFLATVAIYRDDGHVKLDSIVQKLPKKAQALVPLATSCAVALLCVFLCFLTARLTIHDAADHFVLATILNPPKWPLEVIIPVGFFLVFIQAIKQSVSYFRAYRSGGTSPQPPEPAK